MRMTTTIADKAMQVRSTEYPRTFWFDGLMKLCVTPSGDLSAGPSSKAVRCAGVSEAKLEAIGFLS